MKEEEEEEEDEEEEVFTMRMAGAAELSTEEADARKSVMTATWEDRVKLCHRKTEVCTEEEFANVMGLMDVMGLWKR